MLSTYRVIALFDINGGNYSTLPPNLRQYEEIDEFDPGLSYYSLVSQMLSCEQLFPSVSLLFPSILSFGAPIFTIYTY